MNTVYDRIQTMTKDELQKLIYSIYIWGHLNEQCNVDDLYFYQTFLDAPDFNADTVVSSLDKIELFQVRVIPLDDTEPYYLGTKFLSDDDAYRYLKRLYSNIVTVDDTTYATPTIVYKIIPCENKFL